MSNDVTKKRVSFLQAQAKERALRDDLTALESALVEARNAEKAAAIAAIDGGSDKSVATATKRIREIEDQLRVKGLQLSTLSARTRDAQSALDEALAEQRQREQDEGFKALQDEMSVVYGKLSELDDALRAAKARALSMHQRYRAAGGRDHVHAVHRFVETLRQVICNQISEVDLLERGGSPDVLKVMAPLVSGLQFLSIRSAA